MREYETLYLINPDTPHSKVEELCKKIEQIIQNYQGRLIFSQNLGKKRLAYRVEKHHYGVYIYFNYLCQGPVVAEIERILKYDDSVLKFITVVLDPKVKNVEERLTGKKEIFFSSSEDQSEKGAAEVAKELAVEA